MTQCERIIKYINDFGSITSFEAYTDLGITQLGARLHELQKRGRSFKRKQEKGKNRYGEPVHYTRYSFIDQDKMIQENLEHIPSLI